MENVPTAVIIYEHDKMKYILTNNKSRPTDVDRDLLFYVSIDLFQFRFSSALSFSTLLFTTVKSAEP